MLYAFLTSVACPYNLIRHHERRIWRSIQQIFKLLTLQFSPSFYYFPHFRSENYPQHLFCKVCNHLSYPDISGSTEISKSIVCILQLCFIKMYLFYCRLILLFCQYRKLYHVIYVND